jgi:peptide/nickel transport system substrate-binding protein
MGEGGLVPSIHDTAGFRMPGLNKRVLTAAVVAAAASLAVAACSGGTASRQTAEGTATGNVLTVATEAVPQTLDPAKTVQNDAWLEELAYEPLIVQKSNGSLAPGLATSWSYTGTGNTTFVLHLRPGVRFSDGSTLTAQGVAADLAYVLRSAGQMSPFFTGDTFTATGPLTVTIKAAQPNPDFPEILTQDDVVGGMISSKALRSPSLLGTRTVGAGPYMVDPSQTVAGDEYTYVPNPYYYDKAAVYWRKVVVKIIANPQSVLNAMESGQVDVAVGDPSTVSAAGQAGLTVTGSPFLWNGVVLADRGGKLAKPLASVQVRQALNYATNRAAIATALFRGIGSPASQITVPGGYGYLASLNSAYPYNVAKARQLLAAAGYPHGFTLRLVTPEYQDMNLVAEALEQQWQQIGVTLQVTDDANANLYTSAAFGGTFPAFMVAFGQLPIWIEGPSLFLPSASFNPFHTSDPTLASLYAHEARSSGSHQASLDQQIEAFLVHQAWFVPVTATGLQFYARPGITGTSTSAKAPIMELYEVRPAG